MWLQHENCKNVIMEGRKNVYQGSVPFQVCRKLKYIVGCLLRWNKETFGRVQTRITTLLNGIQDVARTQVPWEVKQEMMRELEEWYKREEILWRQKSRVLWLEHDDCNTRFFHTKTVLKRARSNILWLQDYDGQRITEACQIKQHIVQHFQKIFQSSHPFEPSPSTLSISSRISNNDQDDLCWPLLMRK